MRERSGWLGCGWGRSGAAFLALGLVLVWAVPSRATGGDRLALVLANQRYEHFRGLETPEADAQEISKALRKLSFQVTTKKNLSGSAARGVLKRWKRKVRAKRPRLALVYYAGHGIQRDGKNYLIPVDYQAGRGDVERWISVDQLLAATPTPGTRVFVLDACRDDPLTRGLDVVDEVGLARPEIESPQKTLFAYSTEPGKVALDRVPRSDKAHSPYSLALIETLPVPGLSLLDMFNRVGGYVHEWTHGRQTPWVSASPIERICLRGCERISDAPRKSEVPSVRIDGWHTSFKLEGCRRQRQYITCTVLVEASRSTRLNIVTERRRRPILVDELGHRTAAKQVQVEGGSFASQGTRRLPVSLGSKPAKIYLPFRVEGPVSSIPILELPMERTGPQSSEITVRFREVGVL